MNAEFTEILNTSFLYIVDHISTWEYCAFTLLLLLL